MQPSQAYTLELVVALSLIPILLLIALVAGRKMVRRWKVPLGLRYRIACTAFFSWLPLQVYQTHVDSQLAAQSKGPTEVLVENAPLADKPFLFPESLLQGLLALSILFFALVLVKLVRKYFWDDWFERTQDAEAPKFLSDIGSACIVGLSLLLIATGVYHKDLSGMQWSSTVSVAVLGFASQDLLGNLLSGIALQIGSPFRKGDWLLLDGKRLQVKEVNWRSTRMCSAQNVMVDVPNKTVAGSMIVNLSAPTPERASTVNVGFDYDSPPEKVKECLLRAVAVSSHVLAQPCPKVFLKDFGDHAVRYEVVFWVDREEHQADACDAVSTAIWHEAARDGLRMPYPVGRV